MNDNLRACIANLVGRFANQRVNSAVYDHAHGKHIHVSGNASSSSVNLYDHDRGAHISGSPSNLYDHGLGAHVSLALGGTQFKGYDHGSGSHYSGTINGASVTVYDYQTGQHYYYSV
jgi:hypothetical protein